MRISHRQGIYSNGFVSKPITATLGAVKAITGTNRSNITTVSASSQQWFGKFNNYQTLELTVTLSDSCTELDVAIDTKYFTVQVFDAFFWNVAASPTTLSSFPFDIPGSQPFSVSDGSTDIKRLSFHLYGNFKKGTNYIYFGMNLYKDTDFNRMYIIPNTISVTGMSSRKAIAAKSIISLDVFRYSSDDASQYWWKTVRERGGNFSVFGRNRVGAQGDPYYHASCIPIPAATIDAKKLHIRFFTYNPEAHTYRYQLCTSMANKTSYQATQNAVSDSSAITSGTFYDTNAKVNHGLDLTITADIPANTPVYLYLWAYEDGGRAAHILPDWQISAIYDAN